MQQSSMFSFDNYQSISIEEIKNALFSLEIGDRIFFYGDLGSGKTTFIRELIAKNLNSPDIVIRSPTYTYYQLYGKNIYHFDLYRIENPEDLYLIGALDILENSETICLIEWPQILEKKILPTKKVFIDAVLSDEHLRNYKIETFH